MSKKHIIWSNENLNLEDWKADLLEENPEFTEDEMYNRMCEVNGDYLDDERHNLDIKLGQTIIVIADLGLWDGRRCGYKLINSGNIADCLYSDTDYTTWYVDGYNNLRCDAAHHDGTNYYLYRVFKDGMSDEQIDNFCNKCYEGTLTQADISRYTKCIGKEIGKVYGW